MRLAVNISVVISLFFCHSLAAQNGNLKGKITDGSAPIEFANVFIEKYNQGAITDSLGNYVIENVPPGSYRITASYVGYISITKTITVRSGSNTMDFELQENSALLNEVVVSGTMKEVTKLQSPVPVEVYSAKFFKANPTPSVFEALQNINGVKPQINCNVCNTGDIHINGLEGPYTMILIDGMPIVSGLATVYGLSGIPQSLIDRIEVVKGPASTLYGSEAVGGLINIITKRPENAPLFSADIFATSWAETNLDLAGKFNIRKKTQSYLGVNYYNYLVPIDKNKDNFTDVTLQNRVSVFNKWSFQRKQNREFSIAARYVYENRWGGDMNWTKEFRGGDSLYAESIYTKRWEVFGNYQLPTKEKLNFMFSANGHDQNSMYGDMPYIAQQYIGFGQLIWNKTFNRNDLLLGATFRYTYYDDNTTATQVYDTIHPPKNQPNNAYLPGLFIQDEIAINPNNILLIGIRYDHNSIHGNIFTPRLNYKWNSRSMNTVLRMSIGNGYRVANVFTEDHAALTGARKVVFTEDLRPETSWNANLNFVQKFYRSNGIYASLDATAFYTYFTNKIIADYDTDVNKIIYNNLNGYAVSRGVSVNMDLNTNKGFKANIGGTLMDVYSKEDDVRTRQMFSEHFTATWSIGYTWHKTGLSIDYTGNLYSPMRLPLLGELDPRSEFSPWWSIQNIQISQKFKNGIELYGGVKNLLNWTPNKNIPFLIARTNDPFDKGVVFDDQGQAVATPDNPYALTFDPTYMYAPNQGIRGFIGVRYALNK